MVGRRRTKRIVEWGIIYYFIICIEYDALNCRVEKQE